MQFGCRTVLSDAQTVHKLHAQRLQEVPQLYRRKFPEALLDVALSALEEDPASGAVVVGSYEVNAAADRAEVSVRLGLEVDVPASIPALQLAHVTGAFLAGKRSAHRAIHYVPSAIPASYIRVLNHPEE